jgi:steroid delta-isomerase-like uncharacterized protein
VSVEEDKQLVRRLFDHVRVGELDRAAALLAPDFVEHGGAAGQAPGREGWKQGRAMLAAAFPDLASTVEDVVAEGDRVVTRWTVRGTHRGAFMGIPPTGKQATVTGITVWRVAGGAIAESWVAMDRLGLLQQLGVIPSPEQS